MVDNFNQLALDSVLIKEKGLRLTDTNSQLPGMMRYNTTIKRFEGYNGENDPTNKTWHTLNREMASATVLGDIKIGDNIDITEEGVISPNKKGVSRLNQRVITVAKEPGKGDYTNITDAIIYLDDLTSQNSDNKPSDNCRYIVLIAPGIYEENIIIPDYVTLKGDNVKTSIIQGTIAGDGIDLTAAIVNMGENSCLSDITVKHTYVADEFFGGYITIGIFVNTSTENCIRNVNVIMTNSDTHNYGIFIGSTNTIKLNHVDVEISSGLVNTGIYNYMSNTELIHCHFNITAPSLYGNYGVYNSNCQTPIFNGCCINVNGSLKFNIGIKNVNSSPRVRTTHIDVDSDNQVLSYGIDNEADRTMVKLESSLISFINYSDKKDIIKISGANFIEKGFLRNFMIKVTGSSEGQNNQTFTISQVDDDTLTLAANQNLVTSTLGDLITIIQYYTQTYDECQISGYTHSINHVNTDSYYASKLGNTVLNGGLININNNLIYFRDVETIVVANDEGDYFSIKTALDSISDNSPYKRYLIDVRPGIYTETNRIVLKPYVSLKGAGVENTIIKFNISGSDLDLTSSCLVVSSNSSVTSLWLQNVVTSSNKYAQIIYSKDVSNSSINNIKTSLSGSALNMIGINIVNSSLNFTECQVIIDTTENNNTGYAISLNSSDLGMEQLILSVNGESNESNIGIYIFDSDITIRSTNITVTNGQVLNRGIYMINTSNNDKLAIIDECNIIVEDGTPHSLYLDNGYLCVANSSRLTGERYYDPSKSILKTVGCYEIVRTSPLLYRTLDIYGNKQTSTTQIVFIDDNIGNYNLSGIYNTVAGYNAGASLTSGSYNTLIGQESGTSVASGSNLTYMGVKSGHQTTIGDNNTFYGKDAGFNNTTGSDLISIGYKSSYNQISINDNTMIGSQVGYSNTTGINLVFIGKNTGYSNTSGQDSVLIGGGSNSNATGYKTTIGNKNVYIGSRSGVNATDCMNNVLIGYNSGYNNNSSENTMIGNGSGYGNTTGTGNSYYGYNSGYSNVLGNNNTLIGYQVGYNIVVGNNTLLGTNVGYNLSTGVRNLLVGSPYEVGINDSTGYTITTGSDNVLMGAGAGTGLTTGIDNLVIGSKSGYTLSTGKRNVLLGGKVANTISTNNDMIAVGYLAGNQSTKGRTVYIGSYAGQNNNGTRSIFIGHESGKYNTGNDSVFVGYRSGMNSLEGTGSGSSNLVIGNSAGLKLQTGNRNILVGMEAGQTLKTGSDNVMFGYQSGYNCNALNNIFMGTQSGYNTVGNISEISTEGQNNMYLGYKSGYSNVSGNHNIFLGQESGYSSITNGPEICFGYRSGYLSVSGYDNVNIGSYTNYQNTTGKRGISIGYKSGYNNTGNDNILMGYATGLGTIASTNNIIIGYKASPGGVDPDGEGTVTEMVGIDNIIIGNEAGYNLANGNLNLFLGYQAGYNTIDGDYNIFIGDNSGYSNTAGRYNIFIGSSDGDTGSGAGFNNTSGEYNTFMGFESGLSNTIGDNNLFIGSRSGYSNTQSERVIAFGSSAGYGNITGSDNIYFGQESGYNIASGTYNISMGYQTGYGISDSDVSSCIYLGYKAGYNNDTDKNIMVGYLAGYLNTSGDKNISIGTSAGYSNLTGNNNITIGANAGYNNTVDNSIMIGVNAGLGNTTGTNNMCIGKESGKLNESGNSNLLIGIQSGFNNVTDSNMFIGFSAGYTNTTGTNNLFMGSVSGYSNSTGNGNLFIGYETGKQSVSGGNNLYIGASTGIYYDGDNNIFIGKSAGGYSGKVGSGGYNVYIGTETGYVTTSGEYNMAIGSLSARSLSTGSNNMFIGYQTGYNATIGIHNLVIGTDAGYSLTSGSKNLLLGNGAGYSLSTSANNLIIGYQAGYYLSSGENNLIIGYESGFKLLGNKNVCIGKSVGYNMTSSNGNILLGFDSGRNITTGLNNILIGYNTGYGLTTGDNSILIGFEAGNSLTTVSDSICIGYSSGLNTTGQDNLFIGFKTGNNNTTGIRNLYVGRQAGENSTVSSYNIAIGNLTGYSNTSGNYNVSIGAESSYTNTSGNNNINIGYQTGYNFTVSNNIAIGYQAAHGATTLGNNSFIGYLSGYYNFGSQSSTFIGGESGYSPVGTFFTGIGYRSARYGTVASSSVVAIGNKTFYYPRVGANGVYIGYNVTQIGYGSLYNSIIGANICYKLGKGTYIMTLDGTITTSTTSFTGTISPALPTVSVEYLRPGTIGTSVSFNGGILMASYPHINVSIAGTLTLTSKTTFSYSGASTTSVNGLSSPGITAGYAGDELYISGNWVIDIGTSDTSNASSNAIIASRSANELTVGAKNIIIGDNCFSVCTSGKYNTVIGYGTAYNIEGDSNTCIGVQTGYNLADVDNNLMIGFRTGYSAGSTSNNNLYVGYQAGQSNSGNDNIIIGIETTVTESPAVTTSKSNLFAIYSSDVGITDDDILVSGNINKKRIGIGTMTPSNLFDIVYDGSTYNQMRVGYDANYYVAYDCKSDGRVVTNNTNDVANCLITYGSNGIVGINTETPTTSTPTKSSTVLQVNGAAVAKSWSSFTGCHFINVEEDVDYYQTESSGSLVFGLILSSVGKVNKSDPINTIVNVKLSEYENDKKVYGVYFQRNIDNQEAQHMINSVGEGTVWVTNINGYIECGDYITSSKIPGHGMKQNDNLLHTYTVAKATEKINWNNIEPNYEYDSVLYKKVLIGCTYHCG